MRPPGWVARRWAPVWATLLLQTFVLLLLPRAAKHSGAKADAAPPSVKEAAIAAEQLLEEGELEEARDAIASIAVGESPTASELWNSTEVGTRFDHASALLNSWWNFVPKKLRKKHAKVLKARAAGKTAGQALPTSAERQQQLTVAIVSSALLAYMERRFAASFDPVLDLALCTAGARLARASQDGRTDDTFSATQVLGSALLFCPDEFPAATAVLRYGLLLAGNDLGLSSAPSSTLMLHQSLVDSLDSQCVSNPASAIAAIEAAETGIIAYPRDVDMWRLGVATSLGCKISTGDRAPRNWTMGRQKLREAMSRFPRDPVQKDEQGPCLNSACHPQHELAASYAARRWSASPVETSHDAVIISEMKYGRPRHRGGWGWRRVRPEKAGDSKDVTPPPRCTIARVHHSELSVARFREEFADRNLPVMIVGAVKAAATTAGADDKRKQTAKSGLEAVWAAWSKDALLSSHGDEILLVRPSSGIVAAALSVEPWKPGQSVNVTLRRFVESWSSEAREVEGASWTSTDAPMQEIAKEQEVHDWKWLRSQLEADKVPDPPYHFKMPSPGVAREWMAADAELPWFHHRTVGKQEAIFSHGGKLRNERALWFLGPSGSGPFFHVHPAAYNALLYGERRWFVYPPHGLQRPPSVPMAQWVPAYDAHRAKVVAATACTLGVGQTALDGTENASCAASPGGAIVNGVTSTSHAVAHGSGANAEVVWDPGWKTISECVQEAGDVLFIPSGWHHGVLNTQESIGIALELGDNVGLVDAVLRDAE